jgi:hypothetical protein
MKSKHTLEMTQGFLSSLKFQIYIYIYIYDELPGQPETWWIQPSCLQVKLLLLYPPGQELRSFNIEVDLTSITDTT